MRLIDADVLVRDFLKDRDDFDVCVVYDIDIREAPTIDAVPVVRCKDCKQFMEFRDSEKEKQGCDGTCYRLIMHCFDNDFAMVNATDYCSWGVKRDDFVEE